MALQHKRTNPITYSQYMIAKRHTAEHLVSLIPEEYRRGHIIEIGPGTGRLSEFLSQKAGELILIEVDYNLWRRLKEKYTGLKNVSVICGDYMDYELPVEPYVVVSNLPYFLARTMIAKTMRAIKKPDAMYVCSATRTVRKSVSGSGPVPYQGDIVTSTQSSGFFSYAEGRKCVY